VADDLLFAALTVAHSTVEARSGPAALARELGKQR
jgi:hypothetical protein